MFYLEERKNSKGVNYFPQLVFETATDELPVHQTLLLLSANTNMVAFF